MERFYNIVVIGAGGTGGNLIVWLAQFLSGRSPDTYNFVICDGDVVEKKNLARQPFCIEDIGSNKAEALTEALSGGYDIVMRCYPHYIDTVDEIKNMFKTPERGYEEVNLLVGCVDNHHARKLMHELFTAASNLIYIDAANEFSYGEIVSGIRCRNITVSPDRAYYFPEVLEGSAARSEESCTVLNEVAPQHMVTNKMAACLVLSMIANLMQNEVVPEGITHFDAFSLYTRTDHVTGKGGVHGTDT